MEEGDGIGAGGEVAGGEEDGHRDPSKEKGGDEILHRGQPTRPLEPGSGEMFYFLFS